MVALGKWYRRSLSLRPEGDRLGRSKCLDELGRVALARFEDSVAVGEPSAILLEHLNAALQSYLQALDITPFDDHAKRSITEHQFGLIYRRAGDTRQALRHYQQAIQHRESRGDIFAAGETRENIALLLDRDGRTSDALLYARAALDNYQHVGPGAGAAANRARQLIADLEKRSR